MCIKTYKMLKKTFEHPNLFFDFHWVDKATFTAFGCNFVKTDFNPIILINLEFYDLASWKRIYYK